MSQSDFVGDFLTVLRNASRAHLEKITTPSSNMAVKILEILEKEGFIQSFKVFEEGAKKFVRVHLKYVKGRKPALQGIRRISTPGLRRYVGVKKVSNVRGGFGVAIVSTSKGLMTDRQAREMNVGGEFICTVW
jgi:small subunit ribosomal protein S8